jgi:short-subunit dehydrogenase
MEQTPLIVVTGGTKGIGRAIIEHFARQGFDIATCSRKTSDLQVMQELLERQHAIKVYTKVADMAKKEEVKAFGAFVQQLARPVDVLVNNAGLFVPGQIHTEADGVLEQMIDTNLYSAYHLTRSLIEGMKSRKAGHIFNICSTASIVAYPNGGSYCIAKFALLGMSKVLREEMKPHGVRVTSILPGATFTASWAGVDVPEERFMPAHDVAEMVWAAYQLSPRSVVEEILIRPLLGDLG